MTFEKGHAFPCGDIPKPQRAIDGRRDHPRAVRRERAVAHLTCVSGQVLKFVPASPSTEGELADGSWEPLPDTQLRSRFDAWVKDTAAVLHARLPDHRLQRPRQE